MKKNSCMLLLLGLALCGCKATYLHTPSGFTFFRPVLGYQDKVAKISVTTNSVQVEGYTSDAAQAIEAAAAGAARGAKTAP